MAVGCARPVNRISHGLPMPSQTFAHVDPIFMSVSRVDIVSDRAAFEVGEGFSLPLDRYTEMYLAKKLQVSAENDAGKGVVLRAIIEDASVLVEEKGSSYPFLKKIGLDHVKRYSMVVAVHFQIVDHLGRVVSAERVSVARALSVSEHDAPSAREQKQFIAVEGLFDALDLHVSRVILSKMKRHTV